MSLILEYYNHYTHHLTLLYTHTTGGTSQDDRWFLTPLSQGLLDANLCGPILMEVKQLCTISKVWQSGGKVALQERHRLGKKDAMQRRHQEVKPTTNLFTTSITLYLVLGR